MLILAALIPLSLSLIFAQSRVKNILYLLSLAVALTFLILDISTKTNLTLVAPCIFILVILAHQKFFNKSLSIVEIIAVTFAAQAAVLTKTNQVLLLAVITESLFLLSQRNFKAHLRQGVAWIPIIIGIIIDDHGNLFIALSAITLLLKINQWPLNLDHVTFESRLYQLISRAVIPVVIWKTLTVTDNVLWASFWMAVPLFFSWGTDFRRMMIPVMLSVWTLSSELGAISMILWALFFLDGAWMVMGLLGLCAAGFLATRPVPGLTLEMEYIFLALQGFSLARVAVKELNQPAPFSKTYYLSLSALAVIGVGVLAYLQTMSISFLEIPPIVFAASLLGFACILWLVYKKRPRFFESFKALDPIEGFFEKIEATPRYSEKKYSETSIREYAFIERLLLIIEREAYLIMLLGIGAGLLIWGVV